MRGAAVSRGLVTSAWRLAASGPTHGTRLALLLAIGKLVENFWKAAMLRRLILAALLLVVCVDARPARAAEAAGPSIYFGVMSGTSKPIVVTFVFSKPGGFDPIIGFSMAPIGDSCNFNRTTELELPLEFRKSPLYEHGVSPAELTPNEFPRFFSIVVTAELTRLGLVKTRSESLPYTTCTRELWEGLLDPSPNHKPRRN
jgi:hypothetical protein